MLSIALCDDEADKLRETAALVQRYFQAVPPFPGRWRLSRAAES